MSHDLPETPPSSRRPGYDLALVLATVVLLLALAILSAYGTVYSFLASRANPEWAGTAAYLDYLSRMNSLAYPLVAGLVLTMALCIPKRIIPRRHLVRVAVAIALVSASLAVTTGVRAGLLFLLVLSLGLQGAVVALTLARHRGLVFQREGLSARVGSGLLHLGFVAFVLFVVLFEGPGERPDALERLALPTFWAAAIMMLTGTFLAFYADRLPRPGGDRHSGV